MVKKIVAVAAVVAAAVGGYWYYSPYVTLYGMKSAAEKKDADVLNAYVDYPKLRESLKGEFNARIAKQFASGEHNGPGEAFGAMLGAAIVEKFVDTMVRPELIMQAFNDANFSMEGPQEGQDGKVGQASSGNAKEVKLELERKTSNLVIVYAMNPSKSGKRAEGGMVLERTGFADWKLTGFRL